MQIREGRSLGASDALLERTLADETPLQNPLLPMARIAALLALLALLAVPCAALTCPTLTSVPASCKSTDTRCAWCAYLVAGLVLTPSRLQHRVWRLYR